MLTIDDLRQSLPAHLKSKATQELADMVNGAASGEPELAKEISDSFVGMANILSMGRFKVEDYFNAVKFTIYKLAECSNKEAYMRTFPQRYQALVARNASEKDIAAYVAAYAKNKLVTLVLQQSLMPQWVLNQDLHQKALYVQADLMINANSEKVRSDAADSVLQHTKKPEDKQVNIDIGVKETSGLSELKNMLNQLADQQLQSIDAGVSTREIAHQPLFVNKGTTPNHTTPEATEADFIDITPTAPEEEEAAPAMVEEVEPESEPTEEPESDRPWQSMFSKKNSQ